MKLHITIYLKIVLNSISFFSLNDVCDKRNINIHNIIAYSEINLFGILIYPDLMLGLVISLVNIGLSDPYIFIVSEVYNL